MLQLEYLRGGIELSFCRMYLTTIKYREDKDKRKQNFLFIICSTWNNQWKPRLEWETYLNKRYRSLTIITSFGAIQLGSVKYPFGRIWREVSEYKHLWNSQFGYATHNSRVSWPVNRSREFRIGYSCRISCWVTNSGHIPISTNL